ISMNGYKNGGFATLDLFSYGITEAVSGIGVTTYIYPICYIDDIENSDPVFNSTDLFAMEFSWSPFFDPTSIWDAALFFRGDNYLPLTHEFDFRTGARIDLKFPIERFYYPTVSVEVGYWLEKDFYWALKMDPVLLLAAIVWAVGENVKNSVYEDLGIEEEYDPWDSQVQPPVETEQPEIFW
ncbi:MAG: hypothetical protein JXR64_02340, partial [Spirochaetales bacterium]|nr:hypothetical protein [Spirochaetales bacterium]